MRAFTTSRNSVQHDRGSPFRRCKKKCRPEEPFRAPALCLATMSGDGHQPRAKPSDSVAPRANHAGEAAAPNVTGTERDDLSFPPVDFDAGFFARPSRASHEVTEEWPHDVARQLIESPSAKRRRAQLKKYVSLAMGLASAVCLTALVKGALTNAGGNSDSGRHALAAAEHVTGALPEELAVEKTAPQEAPPAMEVALAPQGAAPAAELAAPPPAAVPAVPAPSELPAAPATATVPELAAAESAAPAGEASAADPREALRLKKASQLALEHGRIATSIEAGENAVLLDPLDADAWLILGAAYQQKGDLGQARRCYKACVKRGQRGNRGECVAMLR
jgi:hypothetical protein